MDGYCAPMKVIGVKFDVAAGTGIRSKGYSNKFIGCDFELSNAATAIIFDGDAALYPAPPAGEGSMAIGCGFVGHSAGDTAISVTSLARDTQIVASRYSNVTTEVTDAGTGSTVVGHGQGVFGFESGSQIQLGPTTQASTSVNVKAVGIATDIDLTLASKGNQPIYLSPGGGSSSGYFTTAGLTLPETHLALGVSTGTMIGTDTTQKLGFLGATPILRQSGTPAAATDAATTQTLVNDLRAKLIAIGLIA
jgi:hypothetical protein